MVKKTKMLIVDDEEGIITFLKEFFEARNFEVFQAQNSKQAIKEVAESAPDIILLDINLGKGPTGIDVLKDIKNIDKKAGVIMMTGVKDEEVTKEALKLGALDYITKPLSLSYLDKVVILKLLNLQFRNMSKGE